MFATELCVVARLEPGEWLLRDPLIWQEVHQRIVVPAGFITDLASIPAALRGVLDINGRSRKPAVLHDYLYCAQLMDRAAADELLRRALIAEGETEATARLYWMGVRTGGASHFETRKIVGGVQADDFAPLTEDAAPSR